MAHVYLFLLQCYFVFVNVSKAPLLSADCIHIIYLQYENMTLLSLRYVFTYLSTVKCLEAISLPTAQVTKCYLKCMVND